VLLVGGALGGVAVLVLLFLAPWKGGSPLATERALAAIGDQPVIHVVIERMQPRSTTIDLTSGATTPQFDRTELWFDGARSLFRVRFTLGGAFVSELLQTPRGSFSPAGAEGLATTAPRLDPGLAGFTTRYRAALKSGQAKVVGTETIDGRKAIVIRIRVRAGLNEDVAVDAHSYRPLRLRYSTRAGTSPWRERIIAIETLARNKGQFARPTRWTTPRPTEQMQNDGRVLSQHQAATALGQRAEWPGLSVSGIALARLALTKVTTRWSDGRQTKAHGLNFSYGSSRRMNRWGHWLIVTEGTSRMATMSYSVFDLPPLAPGKLRLVGLGGAGGAHAMWEGIMRKDGLYFFMRSRQRSLILDAARSMTRMP
jgi:hypothetical protein